MRKARFEVDAIRASGAASALWSDEEVLDALNTAMDEAARVLRLVDSKQLARTMNSTDVAIDLITELYAPSSLAIVAETVTYTLPPDFVNIVSILPKTSGFEGVVFRPQTAQSRYMMDQKVIPTTDLISTNLGNQTYWYYLIGNRTLRIAPIPKDNFDIELIYNYRPSRLLLYNASTVTIAGGTPTIVTGAASLWIDAGLRLPAEYIQTADVTTADLGKYYSTIKSIDTNTQITCYKAQTAVAALSAYKIASVPALPAEHHAWLAQMSAALMMRKVNPDTSAKLAKELTEQFQSSVQPELTIRQFQESLPVESYEAQRG